ncbi:MAG: hypothetical protein JRH20_29645 [Deltaproteobacteria bacterium]|nr:hypothetical protein [Deltaproteobacteria bacterium]
MIIKRVLHVRPDAIPVARPKIKCTNAAVNTMESLTPGRMPTAKERPNAIHGLKGGLLKYGQATHRQLLAELYQEGTLRIDAKTGEARWLVKGAATLRLGRFAGKGTIAMKTPKFFALAAKALKLRNERVGEAMLRARKKEITPTGTYTDRWGTSHTYRPTAQISSSNIKTKPDGSRTFSSAGVWYADNGNGPFFGDGNPAETVASAVRYDKVMPNVMQAFGQARTPSKTHKRGAVMLGEMFPYSLRWTKGGVDKEIHFTAGTSKWMVVSEKPAAH